MASLSAQGPTPRQPNFRVQVEAVTQDVVVKDDRGLFVPDLRQTDFEIYEDGVRQQITSMTMVHGSRVTNILEAANAAPPEGVLLPTIRRVDDRSGRILVFFIDDLHIQFTSTPRIRSVFQKIQKELIHDGDLVGIVSSGPSSISVDLTYDHKPFDDLLKKMTGAGLKPSEVVNLPSGSSGGPAELRYREHVALKTIADTLENLDKVHDRRKAIVWLSEGYDFIPFQSARLGMMDPDSAFLQNDLKLAQNQATRIMTPCDSTDPSCQNKPFNPKDATDNPSAAETVNEEFADAQLASELLEITRSANRANTTIYTIDPRGLAGTSDLDQQVEPKQWNEYVRKTQETLRNLADETGGVAAVNMNDFDKAVKRIDNDISDYYVLGYTSTNTDPAHRRRNIEVRVLRRGATVTMQRKEYVMKAPQPAPQIPPSRQ